MLGRGSSGAAGRGDEGFEDRAMGRVSPVQIFRVPLHAEEEPARRIFHGFDDTIR